MFCRKCGKEIPDDSEFCPKCGEKMITEVLEEQKIEQSKPKDSGLQVCSKCGKPIPKGNMFCPSCGTDIPSVEIVSENAATPKKRHKKGMIVGIVAAAVVVFAAVFIPVQVHNHRENHNEFKYLIDDDRFVVIIGYNDDKTDVVIPDTIKGKPVKVIVGSSFENSNITSLELNEGLEIIGPGAFENCKYLETITMRGSSILKSIGEKAFYGCTSLKSIDISVAEECIETGDYAFSKCESLTSIPFNGYLYPLGVGAFENCTSLTDARLYKLAISQRCFANCDSLTGVSAQIGGSIDYEAFSGCGNLSKISIGGETYDNPSKLENAGIAVGAGAFDECENFKDSESSLIGSDGMFVYTFDDFAWKNINDVADMLGAKYVQTGEDGYYSKYSDIDENRFLSESDILPGFKVFGKEFLNMPTSPELVGAVWYMEFGNKNIWLTGNGSCTDNIHIGMTYGEISSKLAKANNLYYSRNGNKLNISSYDYSGPSIEIYFDERDVSWYCHIYIDFL